MSVHRAAVALTPQAEWRESRAYVIPERACACDPCSYIGRHRASVDGS